MHCNNDYDLIPFCGKRVANKFIEKHIWDSLVTFFALWEPCCDSSSVFSPAIFSSSVQKQSKQIKTNNLAILY